MDLTIDLAAFRIVAEALGLGLLVGIERYKGRGPDEKRSSGVRTFATFAVLGAISGLFDSLPLVLTVFGAVALLVIAGYHKSTGSPGLTTEMTALLVFWLGVLLHTHEMLAVGTAIVLTILLASKGALHGFVRDQITEAELFDTLKLLAVGLVVLPLLPQTRLGPYGFLDPRQAWLLVVLVSGIGYAGYFLMKWLGPDRGLRLNALAGGIVSTPATTLSLADRARAAPEQYGAYAVAAIIANVVQYPRLLVLLAVANATLARFLTTPLLVMTATGALLAWGISRLHRGNEDRQALPLKNPFSLLPALKFAAFFVGILLLTQVAQEYLGAQGIYLASALGGLGSVSAVALSLAEQADRGALELAVAARALLLALAVNAVVKIVLAAMHGTKPLTLRLAVGLFLMLAAGTVTLLLG